MNHRLLVNPGTPQEWEIQLKPGANRIGRNEQNDFTINHTSVSGSHCEVTVSDAGVLLQDLGSTNGTFVNRAAVREAWLQPGQHVQFGPVDMTFVSDGVPAPAPTAPAIPIPVPVPGSARLPAVPSGGGLRINKPPAPTEVESAPAEEASEEDSGSPEMETELADAGNAVCKSHPRTPARFLCNRCHKHFCELCVTVRGPGRYCRSCGQPLTHLRAHVAQPRAQKGFYARVPGAFVYPFRGIGLLILVCATIAFLALEFVSGGIFGFFIQMALYGFVFLFMQNIIHSTTSDENEPLSFPEASGLFGAFFELLGTILVSFGLPIALLVARSFFEVEIPVVAIIAVGALSCFYFPMAFLAVAMKDSVMAANPLVVIPAILKIPLEYFVAAILLMAVFALRLSGGVLASFAGSISLETREMSTLFIALGAQAVWSFISVYLLTVSMRILGLLYLTKKHKFGWFSH